MRSDKNECGVDQRCTERDRCNKNGRDAPNCEEDMICECDQGVLGFMTLRVLNLCHAPTVHVFAHNWHLLRSIYTRLYDSGIDAVLLASYLLVIINYAAKM